jgi:hypothetical protein
MHTELRLILNNSVTPIRKEEILHMKLQSRRWLTAAVALSVMASPLSAAFPTMTLAQDAAAVAARANPKNVPAPSSLGTLDANAAPKNIDVPDAVQKGIALRQSLTSEQQQAVRSILNRYQGKMDAISKDLPAVDPANLKSATGPVKVGSDGFSAQLQRDQATLKKAKAATAALKALQAQMNGEISTVLTQEQAAQFQSSLSAAGNLLDKFEQAAASKDGLVSAQSYTSNCYYAGYYAALGTYYAYYHYINAYYHYLYESADSYAYYGYLYSYYAYFNYAQAGLKCAGATYFDEYVLGTEIHGNAYDSYYYLYWASYYAYYAYLDSYYSYIYYGGSYGYYAYLYGYNSQYYLYYAYYYAYWCYYYA